MIQWIGILLAVIGLAYNGVKDYQKGEIKLPPLPQKTVLTKPVYPIQYCLMAYDPNLDKVFYQHENGTWYDSPPQIRKYQDQSQEELGTVNGTSGRPSQYGYGQSAQASTNTKRY